MRPVTEHELQGMLARRQLQRSLGLSLAEMNVLLIGWNRRDQFVGRERRVDQQMMMPGVRPNTTLKGLVTVSPSFRLTK
jgi:hypothetical protein